MGKYYDLKGNPVNTGMEATFEVLLEVERRDTCKGIPGWYFIDYEQHPEWPLLQGPFSCYEEAHKAYLVHMEEWQNRWNEMNGFTQIIVVQCRGCNET